MTDNPVRQLRVVLNTEDFEESLAFYRDTLGLTEAEAYTQPDGARVVILDAGRATLELANPAQSRYIADVETGGVASTPVRLAFEVDDAAAVAAELDGAAGGALVAAPVRTPWNSLNARLTDPAGRHVTIFQELGFQELGDGLLGADLAALGGERGALARAVGMARENGTGGQLPFAAIVVRDGVVIGAGVNTAIGDADPTAHGEVAAVRDACRRAGSLVLSPAVVYSSCEPCAICRTVAAAAGVREIVFAAGKELVPTALDPAPNVTARLIDAVTALLPGIARRGDAGLSEAELAAPFEAYLLSR